MRRLFFSLILYAAYSVFYPLPVHAATTSLTVSPAILENVVTPGKSIQATVTLTNNTTTPLPIKGTARSFTPNQNMGTNDLAAFNASSWFTLSPADFILQPLEHKDIVITITAPKKVEPGGHYATIYFEPLLPREMVNPATAQSLSRVGVLAFLIAPGDIQEHLILQNVTVPRFQSFGPLDLNLSLSNTGNLHLQPTGKFTVTDMFGRAMTELSLDPTLILPGTTQAYHLSWPRHLLFGPYTVTGNILYGSEHTSLPLPVIKVWFVPIPLVLLTITILTIVFWFVIVGRKRFWMAWRVLSGKAEAWELKEIKL
jgi:hypothetical protein